MHTKMCIVGTVYVHINHAILSVVEYAVPNIASMIKCEQKYASHNITWLLKSLKLFLHC